MQTSEALNIIRALADGINPITGEVLEEDSLCQNPQIIRALFAAAQALEKPQERPKREENLPANAGQSWESEEEQRLCAEFDAGLSVNQLAQKHQRTNGSIQSRLVKLGKILLTPNQN